MQNVNIESLLSVFNLVKYLQVKPFHMNHLTVSTSILNVNAKLAGKNCQRQTL